MRSINNSPRLVEVKPVGTQELTFDVSIPKDQFHEVLQNHGRSFRFDLVFWNTGTLEGRIRISPDNGIVQVSALIEDSEGLNHEK